MIIILKYAYILLNERNVSSSRKPFLKNIIYKICFFKCYIQFICFCLDLKTLNFNLKLQKTF